MIRRWSPLLGIVAALALLAGSWATGATLAAFSDTTNNPGNTFSAASSFCAGPSTQTVTPDADSYVSQNAPGSNYGTTTVLHVQSRGGGRNRRTLVHFPLPAAQYCAVTSATLRINVTTVSLGRTLQAYQLGAPWVETTVTWANQPSTVGGASTAPSALGWAQFDVTTQVQGMYAGSNNGFIVRDSVEGQNPASLQVISSREALLLQPELVINFA